MLMVYSADFSFQNQLFQKISLRSTIRVSNGVNQDQDGRSGLGPKCLQRFSSPDDKFTLDRQRVRRYMMRAQHLVQRSSVDNSYLLSCKPKVTVMSCFVYKVIRDL